MTDIFGLKVIDTSISPRPSINSTNPDDFIFNSIWNTVKVWKCQMSSVSIAAGTDGYIEVAHGLSFIPASFVYTEADPDNAGRFYFGVNVAQPSSLNSVVFDSYCNSTKLHVDIHNPYSGTKTFRVYSFIFADNGQ
jgi:hypothetical protein